jgi:hypothetical protein
MLGANARLSRYTFTLFTFAVTLFTFVVIVIVFERITDYWRHNVSLFVVKTLIVNELSV